MILTPLIDIDNLNLSIFWTFMVIDDKGRENKDISDISTWEEKQEILVY